MRSEVFQSVAADSAGRRGYSRDVHERVDTLVEEWLSHHNPMAARAGGESFERQVHDCSAYVCARYRQDFGIPLIGWLLWPVISGLINWLVQRTLERMFPGEIGRRG